MSDLLEQFENWKTKLDKAVDESLLSEVAEEAAIVMKEKIQTEVYGAYIPTQYVRREGNGGLLDEKNIKYTLKQPHNLIVENVAHDNGYTGTNRYISNVVETGKGYTWENSKIYKSSLPRPFHKPAEEELVLSGRAEKALIKGVKKRGIK